ncbi:hypothetical protein GWO43_01220 [candidate division KSB1 bacterium]|nr:hypothetical protein [candidate division KSB1 bacterium]NIR69298.1 hypothetical protein [candidate division KSB1 bacterium]NIS22693.1 hypothetical protein [candidate division KSB1 bacterium]NIT69541.1 hypothetical protein [candidate division KSB1 bacterium]NIU23195.1 hypothetical protein [candidate division KSB1 bacterium]
MKKTSVVLIAFVLLTFCAFALFLNAQEKKEEPKQIAGTLVDLACYAKAGYLTNDHGDMKNCGTMCASGGLPVALVDVDKNVHFLAVPAPGYAEYVGQEVRLTGNHGKHADAFIPTKLEVKKDGEWVEKKLPRTMM